VAGPETCFRVRRTRGNKVLWKDLLSKASKEKG
jgi:hypothetical protein